MRNPGSNTFWWGILLVAAGAVWLVGTLGLVDAHPAWPALLFGLAGGGFAAAWARDRARWWAAIPAGALLGLAGLVAWDAFAPSAADEWGASVFLGLLGAGFWAVYLHAHDRWWAIIPGGVLLTLAVFIGLTPVLTGTAVVAPLFFGLALTFALLAILPTGRGHPWWPLVPAGVLAVLGVLFAIEATTILAALEYAWPVALIAGGLYVIWRASGRGWRRAPRA
jgi:hypothetical protein